MFIDYSQDGVEKKRVIVCAASVIMSDIMLCGVRHGDDSMFGLYDAWVRNLVGIDFDNEQGFIDNKGNFLTREEAWVVAYDAGQIRYICGGQSNEREGNRLYSENLY